MAFLLFWKCECGTEWRASVNWEGKTTTYVCRCKRRQEVRGSVVDLHYLPAQSEDRVWKKAPGNLDELPATG